MRSFDVGVIINFKVEKFVEDILFLNKRYEVCVEGEIRVVLKKYLNIEKCIKFICFRIDIDNILINFFS